VIDSLPLPRQRQCTDLPARHGEQIGGRVAAQHEGARPSDEHIPSVIDGGTLAIRRTRAG
jgi:hypothetical protein